MLPWASCAVTCHLLMCATPARLPGPPTTISLASPRPPYSICLQSWHDFPADGSAEIYLLQWVYGNVAHAGTGVRRCSFCACNVVYVSMPCFGIR